MFTPFNTTIYKAQEILQNNGFDYRTQSVVLAISIKDVFDNKNSLAFAFSDRNVGASQENVNTFNKLDDYVNLLLSTNKKFNLIGKSTEENIWQRHIIDSIQLIKLLNLEQDIVIDVGTGAGIPGIILSICGVNTVYLVESKTK